MMLWPVRECKKIPKRSFVTSLIWVGQVLFYLAFGVGDLAGRVALSQPTAMRVERALSQQERAELLSTVRPLVATITRTPSFPTGVHPVGEQSSIGHGLWLSHNLILTAEAWLERAPLEVGVTFTLSDHRKGDPTRPLKILYRSAHTGLAIIQSSAEGARPPSNPLRVARIELAKLTATLPNALSAPRTLWALTDERTSINPIMLTGRGSGAEAYYWKLSAPMRWGDPLFNADGAWIGTSCASGRLLPLEAVRDLIKELP